MIARGSHQLPVRIGIRNAIFFQESIESPPPNAERSGGSSFIARMPPVRFQNVIVRKRVQINVAGNRRRSCVGTINDLRR